MLKLRVIMHIISSTTRRLDPTRQRVLRLSSARVPVKTLDKVRSLALEEQGRMIGE